MTGAELLRSSALLLLATAAAPAQTSIEPFTPAARWSYYAHRTYGPTRLAFLAADTAIDHAFHDPGCWDSGAGSYGRRYARALERRIIRNTTELATGLLTGEDLRYRSSQRHSVPGRVWTALRASVTARMPDGTERPAYTRFFSNTVAEVSTAHLTRQHIRPAWMMQSLAWSALGQAQTNLLDEFGPDLRRVGARIGKRILQR